MADNDNNDAQEKTEQATPRRRAEAREKGQIPRSRELSTMLVLLVGAGTLAATSKHLGDSLFELFRSTLSLPRPLLFDSWQMYLSFRSSALDSLMALAPFLIVMTLIAMVAPLALGGWIMNFDSLNAKLDRMDPIKGLKKVFGARGLVEMFKALAKFALIGTAAVGTLYLNFDTVIALGHGSLEKNIGDALMIVSRTFLIVASTTIIIAMIDVPYQLWEFARNLRMSRQQVKEELKDTEGRPEVRSKIRQTQQELATRRMMEDVPKADVIVTNPTHYAVALRYNPDQMGAPRVVAKGTDLIAQRIREVAGENGVACFSAPPLARALYYSTRISQEIPAGLYVAVAQVLAYVFQLRKGAEIVPPAELPIPAELER